MWSRDDYCSTTSGISLSACEWRIHCEICAIQLSCHLICLDILLYYIFILWVWIFSASTAFFWYVVWTHPGIEEPTGEMDCTYTYKKVGEISIDELEGATASCGGIRWDFGDGVIANSNRVLWNKKRHRQGKDWWATHLRGILWGAMIMDTMVVPALWGISSFDDLMKKGGYEYSRSTDKASLVVGGATFNCMKAENETCLRLLNFKIRPHTDWHASFKGFSTSSEDA